MGTFLDLDPITRELSLYLLVRLWLHQLLQSLLQLQWLIHTSVKALDPSVMGQPYPRANKGLLPTEEVALQHSKNGAFSRSELFMETHNTTRFFAEEARIHRVYQYYNARSQLIFAQIIQSDIKTTTSKLLSNYLHFLFICDLYKILQLWSSKNIS